ncbi:MAG: 23S rRNA (guanosine(2251)-2'-O)-methyltransferase RlmB [Halomonadaceae bacterium]|nr:MAG: 23S rRNA (guanosine(2251)-2'-O)-methyltransferase RlmB [Halomonadaceae bacterium]
MAKQTLFGWHAVQSLVENQPDQVVRVHLQQGREDSRVQGITESASRFGIALEFSSRKALDEMAGQGSHQGIVALVKAPKEWQESDLDDLVRQRGPQLLLLVLDGVTDPHNLGACLRTADAAGVNAVLVPKDKSAALTPAAIKVASGAAQTLPLVRVTNLARSLRSLQQQGVWVVGTAGEADSSLYQASLTGPLALVMGAEGKGLRRLTREHCDQLVNLPMQGTVGSLNVSVAAGVCLFEAVRQRQAK